jgi:hypothetical protein
MVYKGGILRVNYTPVWPFDSSSFAMKDGRLPFVSQSPRLVDRTFTKDILELVYSERHTRTRFCRKLIIYE